MTQWYKIHEQKAILRIFAKPHAKKTALLKVNRDGLHISLHAKPHEGEANKALIVFIAVLFRIPKSQVILQRGASSRHKEIVISLTASVQKTIDELTKLSDES
jgi:uncharacterized protein (TIGR00251 family)